MKTNKLENLLFKIYMIVDSLKREYRDLVNREDFKNERVEIYRQITIYRNFLSSIENKNISYIVNYIEAKINSLEEKNENMENIKELEIYKILKIAVKEILEEK